PVHQAVGAEVTVVGGAAPEVQIGTQQGVVAGGEVLLPGEQHGHEVVLGGPGGAPDEIAGGGAGQGEAALAGEPGALLDVVVALVGAALPGRGVEVEVESGGLDGVAAQLVHPVEVRIGGGE